MLTQPAPSALIFIAQNPSPSRPRCARCLRPHNACLCPWTTPVVHPVEVLILQHPLEVHEAKGTARLLHLSLPRSRMAVGEAFDAPTLHALLTAPFDCCAAAPRTVLLYPASPHDAALGLPTAPALDPAWLQAPERLRLVVLDGTWRKSRKMLYLNHALQQLPRLPLAHPPASRYATIRKAPRAGQLSTLEATAAALEQLGGDATQLAPLWHAFEKLVRDRGQRSGRGLQGDADSTQK